MCGAATLTAAPPRSFVERLELRLERLGISPNEGCGEDRELVGSTLNATLAATRRPMTRQCRRCRRALNAVPLLRSSKDALGTAEQEPCSLFATRCTRTMD
jgi:hypothetical protein